MKVANRDMALWSCKTEWNKIAARPVGGAEELLGFRREKETERRWQARVVFSSLEEKVAVLNV